MTQINVWPPPEDWDLPPSVLAGWVKTYIEALADSEPTTFPSPALSRMPHYQSVRGLMVGADSRDIAKYLRTIALRVDQVRMAPLELAYQINVILSHLGLALIDQSQIQTGLRVARLGSLVEERAEARSKDLNSERGAEMMEKAIENAKLRLVVGDRTK